VHGRLGTFCHENHGQLARGLADRYQVILFDYRGIRDSGDDLSVPSTMELHANDAIGLLDHLGLKNVHEFLDSRGRLPSQHSGSTKVQSKPSPVPLDAFSDRLWSNAVEKKRTALSNSPMDTWTSRGC